MIFGQKIYNLMSKKLLKNSINSSAKIYNSTIICGTIIGRYAFIGAGSVVTKDVPDQTLAVGNPATQIGWVCVCGERLSDKLKCSSCRKKYKISQLGIKEIHT